MLFVYMVVLMAGFNSISHGTQDLYPTFLKSQLGFSPTQATVVTVVGQLGAISGGMTVGWLSTFTGRRLAMMVACLLGGALVPPYVLLRNNDLIASAFFEQFFVGGVWGPIPAGAAPFRDPHGILVADAIVGVSRRVESGSPANLRLRPQLPARQPGFFRFVHYRSHDR